MRERGGGRGESLLNFVLCNIINYPRVTLISLVHTFTILAHCNLCKPINCVSIFPQLC